MPFTSDFTEQILGQLSKAILLAVKGDLAQRRSIPRILRDLAKLEIRPTCLTLFAYEWCSAIYENREHLEGWEGLLLVCLELGFRHFDAQRPPTDITLTHTEHHRGLVDIVFKSRESEVIADFLHAWTTAYNLPEQAGEMASICTGLLAGLHNLVPFSPRLRRLAICFVEIAGYRGFESAGVEKLIDLLNHLRVTVEEMHLEYRWSSLLLDVIRFSEGPRRLSHLYWEFLVELAVSKPWWLGYGDTNAPKIAKALIDAEEWGKLECWIGIEWVFSGSAGIIEEDLEHPMLLLFRQRPGAAQKLEQWMERWSQRCKKDIPESFQRILTRAHEAVQRQDAP